jgi:hypothetical protein
MVSLSDKPFLTAVGMLLLPGVNRAADMPPTFDFDAAIAMASTSGDADSVRPIVDAEARRLRSTASAILSAHLTRAVEGLAGLRHVQTGLYRHRAFEESMSAEALGDLIEDVRSFWQNVRRWVDTPDEDAIH